MQNLNQTAQQILDIAEYYTQTRGYNAFSYKDIQHEVGIKTSSIHYYFPTKQDLALIMTARYIERFNTQLNDIAEHNPKGLTQLNALCRIYVDTVKQGKFCLCGMLASDMSALPPPVTNKLNGFFKQLTHWITDAIELGKQQGDIHEAVRAKAAAAQLLATLEGGMLIARAQNKPSHLANLIAEALQQMQA